jgi:hypothetical protein
MSSPAQHVLLISAVAAFGAFASPARAGDDPTPASKDMSWEQARCQALGEGYFGVKGSTNCIRISGYISAGVDFGGATKKAEGTAASHVVGFSKTWAGVSIETHFDTEFGPSSIYVEINGTNMSALSGSPERPFSPAADR